MNSCFQGTFFNYEDTKHDGLRIYFASYPAGSGNAQSAKDSGYNLVPPKKFNKMALIFGSN